MNERISDDELMQMIRNGQAKAFETLYDRHTPAVFGYCLRTLGGNRAMAEDILQEVWSKVVLKIDLYEGRGHFKAWLMTITRNETISQIRGQLILHDDAEKGEPEIRSEEMGIEESLIERHDTAKVQQAIDELPAIQRTVLTLWLADEQTYDQMAATLGLTEPAVRTYLFRAKRALREKLEGK